jgi:hypothetical protein
MQREQTALRTDAADAAPPLGLPVGSAVQRIEFASERGGATCLWEFTTPERRSAIVVGPEQPASLVLLSVPSQDLDQPEMLATVRAWIERRDSGSADAGEPGVMITLHGAQIFWQDGRAAIIASSERLAAAKTAVVEFAFHDGLLRSIERDIAARWPELEGDAPLAFDFHERWLRRRDELARRFQAFVLLRTRFVRLVPLVNRPPVYPPTLASQISERLRERTRIVDRLDFSDGQLEVFERVYELCAERSSEFVLARKGHVLEWIIIVFLAFQTLLLVLERIASLGT